MLHTGAHVTLSMTSKAGIGPLLFNGAETCGSEVCGFCWLHTYIVHSQNGLLKTKADLGNPCVPPTPVALHGPGPSDLSSVISHLTLSHIFCTRNTLAFFSAPSMARFPPNHRAFAHTVPAE